MSDRYVAVVDYGAGNLRSAAKALAAAGDGVRVEVTDDPDMVRGAERLVLPGVGAFADCMAGLKAKPGLVEAVTDSAIARQRPFLGICVGMQLLAEYGIEYGKHAGLGWLPGTVERLTPADPDLKIPQIGWNELVLKTPEHPLFAGLAPGDHAYFVHSYGFRAGRPETVMAEIDFGGPVVAAIGRDNILGVQFHPEKSQRVGLKLLANFIAWQP